MKILSAHHDYPRISAYIIISLNFEWKNCTPVGQAHFHSDVSCLVLVSPHTNSSGHWSCLPPCTHSSPNDVSCPPHTYSSGHWSCLPPCTYRSPYYAHLFYDTLQVQMFHNANMALAAMPVRYIGMDDQATK